MLISIISYIFISDNQLFKLTAHDMKIALVNEKLENHGSQRASKWLIINPLTLQSKFQPLFRLLVITPTTLQPQFQPLFKSMSSRKVSNQLNYPNSWHNATVKTRIPLCAVPTASQASCDHTIKPKCVHNPIDIPVQWL